MLQILLVDDEPTIRLSLGDALRNAGHSVKTAVDGAAALKLAGREDFDVIVTDLRMPKVDGLTVLHRIRAELPSTEVIVITAFGTAVDANAARLEGAAAFVTKPFDVNQLLRRIAEIDERRAAGKCRVGDTVPVLDAAIVGPHGRAGRGSLCFDNHQ